MEEQNFCLRWDSYQSSITAVFDHLRRDDQLVDVTLCSEGHRLRAHRMVLAACSPYFRQVLSETPCQHLVLFLRDTSAADLRAVVEFMYRGVVNVAQSQLTSFIKTAEMLQIRGLSADEDKSDPAAGERPERSASSGSASSSGSAVRETPPPAKRWRHSSAAAASGPSPASSAASGPSPAAAAAAAATAAAGGAFKLEKLDPTDDDDDITEVADVSLDAALGCVAAYEDGRLEGGVGRAGLSGPAASSVPPGSPGPGRGVSNHHSISAGNQHPCDICGKVYKYRISLLAHRKHHEGRTNCFVCGHTSSTVQNLRQHLRFVHRLAPEEVSRRTGLQRVRMSAAETTPLLLQQSQAAAAAARWPGGPQALRQTAAGVRQGGVAPQVRPMGYRGLAAVPQAVGQSAAVHGPSVGPQGMSVGTQGMSVGTQGLSVGPQGLSVGTQGLSAGAGGQSDATRGLCVGQSAGLVQGQSEGALGPAVKVKLERDTPTVPTEPEPVPGPSDAAADSGQSQAGELAPQPPPPPPPVQEGDALSGTPPPPDTAEEAGSAETGPSPDPDQETAG